MDYPKRLIEVDLPIKRISAHARREKSIRHGHISTLHIWWARRPLAACRAVICAALWPDPADEKCPPAFRDEARRLMADWAQNHLDLTSPESMSRFNRVKNDSEVLTDNVELRKALLDFIADFANWDHSGCAAYLSAAHKLTKAAHLSLGGGAATRPVVVDSFAGGGSIPLEATRVGADAFASDLNPVAVLLNKILLEYVPKCGARLATEIRKYGAAIAKKAEEELSRFYPADPDGAIPIAYLWARSIQCEGPGCGAEVPLIRSLWLSKNPARSSVIQLVPRPKAKRVDFRIVTRTKSGWVLQDAPHEKVPAPAFQGTVQRGSATCPCCGFTTPVARVKEQLRKQRGGADNSRLFCVVTTREGQSGRHYRLPHDRDKDAVQQAADAFRRAKEKHRGGISLAPDEDTPVGGGRGAGRAFGQRAYGMDTFSDLFTARQLLGLTTLARLVRDNAAAAGPEVASLLALCVDRVADKCASLVFWHDSREFVDHVFARQALSLTWNFAEAPVLADVGWVGACEWIAKVVDELASARLATSGEGSTAKADASSHPLPSDAVQAFISDPPYYDAVPYSDLSDFFYVWLKRCLPAEMLTDFSSSLTPKNEECIVDEVKGKDASYFETTMERAMAEGRRILEPSGIATVVFAHKSTSGWEALLQAMIDAGWVVTASWPIDTEMATRLRAKGSAALASSVHLVCRPRENESGDVTVGDVGDWRSVLSALPTRIHEWMPRLAEEGVVGADAIFACLGPALEIFSRYSRVEKASGEVVTLREYLEQVWAAVSTEALSMIFRDADAAGLESDARFTAIVLWTLGAGGTGNGESDDSDAQGAEDDDEDEESPKGKAAKSGYTLEYDAARKIAQGLGVNLEQIDSVVEVKGDKARLLPVSERAAALFGKAEKAEAANKKRGKKATQRKLFDKESEEGGGKTETVTFGDGAAATPGVTALDRVHQAMLLFAGGRADALKRFIVEDGVGGDARFWKLAQSLSALYPAGSDEKRWVDGVLARKKSFGF